MADLEAQLEQLQAEMQQKDNVIAANQTQIQSLGAFQAEAMNGRDKIASLEAKVSGLEKQASQATSDANAAKSALSSASHTSAAAGKKVAAAEDLAKALKVFLGS